MPMPDKIAAAKKISEFLNAIIANGDFRLRYKITVDPPVTRDREWEHPEILVELSGCRQPAGAGKRWRAAARLGARLA